jgi:hypothetical protein
MEPITRAQLQNARDAFLAEQERIAHRELEIKGQLAAEALYKEVKSAAQAGRTQASSKSMELGVAFDTLLFWTKEHFPDCDVSTEIRHISHSPTYAVRVDWSEPIPYPQTIADLETRRLEKATSW